MQISVRQSVFSGPQYPGINSGRPPGTLSRHCGVVVGVGVAVGVNVAQPPLAGVLGVPVVVGAGPTHDEFRKIAGGVPLGQTRLH